MKKQKKLTVKNKKKKPLTFNYMLGKVLADHRWFDDK